MCYDMGLQEHMKSTTGAVLKSLVCTAISVVAQEQHSLVFNKSRLSTFSLCTPGLYKLQVIKDMNSNVEL